MWQYITVRSKKKMQWYKQYKLVLRQYTYTCSRWVIWSAVPTVIYNFPTSNRWKKTESAPPSERVLTSKSPDRSRNCIGCCSHACSKHVVEKGTWNLQSKHWKHDTGRHTSQKRLWIIFVPFTPFSRAMSPRHLLGGS